MPELFNTEEVDLSSIYRDSAAPKDPDPSELLFSQLGAAIKTGTAPVGLPTGRSSTMRPFGGGDNDPANRAPRIPTRTGPGVPAAGAPNQGKPATGPASSTTAVLARLKPLGITSFAALKGKTDVELRKLSQDVVTYELRQQSLSKYFKQNPDGSWDFTVGPDGNPTGLDASGKPIVKQPPAVGGAPAPKPAPAPAPAPVKPPPTGSAVITRGSNPSPTVTRPPTVAR